MKRMIKRWMAMLLAVLMVMGTLPTSAWAARMTEDTAMEQPVLDGANDPVADTQARYDKDDERPEQPVDPDPGPGELHNANIGNLVIDQDAVKAESGIFATAENTEGSDYLVVMILPRFKLNNNPDDELVTLTYEKSPADSVTGWFHAATSTTTLTQSKGVLQYFASSPDMPYYYYKTTNGAAGDKIAVDWAGKIYESYDPETGAKTEKPALTGMSLGSINNIKSAKVSSYIEGKTLYDPETNEKLDYTNGIPFTVFLIGSSGFDCATMYVPVSDEPLKVQIVTKDAVMKTAFNYNATAKSTAAKWNGEQQFTEVILTNNTSADMTVNVTIVRGALKKDATGYGTTTNITDASASNVRTLITDLDYTPNTSTGGGGASATVNATLAQIYGLLEIWKGSLNTNDVVPAKQNDPSQTELTNITIPANGSKTIYVAGTANSGTGTLIGVSNGFGGVKDSSSNAVNNFWSTYKITATPTSAAHADVQSVSDTAGIRWEASPVTRPKVRLIHGTDKSAIIKREDDIGNIINGQDSLIPDSTGTKYHTVIVKDKDTPLEWNEAEQYWELPASNTLGVGINKYIEVDGVRTDAKTLVDENEIIYVSMGTVTVTADPLEKAGDILGHYMWDTKATTDWKKVSYSYYPYGATVGVYAKKEGFLKWTGANYVDNITDGTGVMTEPDYKLPTEATDAGKLTKVAAAQVKVSGDVTAIANYAKPITLVTTYGGKEPGDNTIPNQGDRSIEYVFKIEVKNLSAGNVTEASWTDGAPENKITEQTETKAWEIDLPAGTYRLYINNRPVGSTFSTSAPPVVEGEGTTPSYNFVVELAGVIPMVKGSTNSADKLTLPGDGSPANGDGNVDVTGATPNTDKAIKLYYPTVSSVPVSGTLGTSSLISKLTYPEDNDDNKKDVTSNEDNTWKPTANNGNMTFTKSNTNPLTAHFGAATGSVEITVLKNGDPYTDQTVTLSSDSTSDTAASGRTVYPLSEGTKEGSSDGNGVHTNGAVDPNATGVTNGKFYVFVGGKYVNKSVTVTAGATEPAKATVEYFTLTVTNADGKGYIGLSTSDMTTALTADGTTTDTFLKDTKVYIRADAKNTTNYTFNEWSTADGGSAPVGTGNAKTYISKLEAETTVDASFNKSKYQTQLHVTLNGDNGKIDDDITKVECSGDGTTVVSKGNGVWEATVSTKQTWTVTTRSGAYTVETNGDVDGTDYTAQTMKLYSVDVEKGDYGNDNSNAPYIGDTAGTTRVIVEKDKTTNTVSLTLVPNPKNGYERDEWVNAAEGATSLPTGASVSGDALTLGTDYEPTDGTGLVLKPTFTYWTHVKVVNSAGTALTGYTPSANGENGEGVSGKTAVYKISGLAPSVTDGYALVANGYTSTVKVTPTNAGNEDDPVLLHMYTVSVAAGTGGSATLTGGTKYLPKGATDSTGWTITATQSSGYRLKGSDGKQWKLTSGGTYGTLDDDTAASTTLKVETAIQGDVVATAYFTQQWTVNSYVNGSTAGSAATLDGGTGAGTGSGDKSTKTIDAGGSVQVSFDGGPGESLNGWSLTGGGSWNTDNGSTWTTWADNAKPTGASFYFKPSADSTIVAAIKTKEYPVQVIVRKDGTELTDASGITVKLGTKTLDYDSTNGYWTTKLEPNNTTGYVLNTDVAVSGGSNTTKTMKFVIADGEKLLDSNYDTGNAANLKLEVDYWTVTVETGGNGNAKVAGDTRNATTDYAAATPVNTKSFVVEDGKALTWSTPNIATNYKLNTWQVKGTDNNYTDVATTALPATAAATVTYRAVFAKKTLDITVEIKLDDEADTYTENTAPYTVTLTNSGVTATQSATENNKYTFSGVPYNEGETAYTLTVSRTGYYGTYSLPNITVKDGATTSYPVNYYTAKAKTNGTTATARGNAKLTAGTGESALTARTDYKAATGATVEASIVVLSGTSVTWEAIEPADNYNFGYWDSDTTANKTTPKTQTVSAKGVVHTAYFVKEKYNTYLNLTVNGEKWGTKGTVDGVADKNITNVQLVTADKGTTDVPNVTVTYKDGLWEAKGVSNEYTAPYWRVTTADGAVYYTPAKTADLSDDATVAASTADETLIGVTIEDGVGNGTGYKPTLLAKVVTGGPTTAGSPKGRVVIRKGQQVTVALNKKDGYDFKSPYLAGNAANPTADLTAAQGTGDATTFTLASGYTAPANHADLYIKPQYTFTTTVVTKYGGDPTDMTTVQIKEGTNVTKLDKETTGTGDHTGRYTATGLDTDKTYTVIVNGFESKVTFDKEKAGGDVDVTVFKVTVKKVDKLDASLNNNIDGSAGVNLGAAMAANGGAASVYLPIGATTTAATDDDTTIHLQAAVAASSPKFRLYNKDDTATTGQDEILWDVAFTKPAETTKMDVDVTTKTDTQTPNNLTVGGDDGMQADVTVTAYFLRQYDVTANVKDDKSNLANKSTVKMTVTGLGSKAPTGTNPKNEVKASNVDEQSYVKVEFTKGVGETLTGWTFSNGDLYTTLEDDGTLSGQLNDTTAGASTATTLYFVPTADKATVTAKVLQATYPVTVKVNLNNAPYVDANHKLKVELRYGTDWTSSIPLYDAVTADGTTTYDGVFTTKPDKQASPGTTYRIYVNGVDLGTVVDTERAKDINFEAYAAEGKKADGTDADDPDATIKAALEREINYYTLKVAKSFSDNKTPTNVYAHHGDMASAANEAATGGKEKIVLAKVALQPDQKAAATSSISITAASPYYKFINWTVSKDGDSNDALNITTNEAVGIYTLPAEGTLTANTKIKTDGGVTLTANFKRQFKVTVTKGDNATTVKVWTGTETAGAQTAVLVDEDGSVNIKSTGADLFKDWTIPTDKGKGNFTNNTDKGGKGAVGYLAEDTFAPEADSELVATYWKDAAIKAGWTYDIGTGDNTKASSDGVAAQTVPWTQNDAQETKPLEIKVYGPKNTDGTYPATGTLLPEVAEGVTKGYTWDDDAKTYTLSKEYLNELTPNKTYKVEVKYTLGKPAGHTNQEVRYTTAEFLITQSAFALTKVDIQVKDGTPTTDGSATASIDDEGRDNVKHKLHVNKEIKDADLTWTWFYSDTIPGQKELKDAALTNYEASVTAGTPPTGWNLLSASMSGNTGATYNNFDITNNANLKGKYIFAVVKATDSGTGTVITNAILVDFDAKITLKKNNSKVTADNAKYSVYLWPADAEGDFALDSAIPTEYVEDDQSYNTKDSALTSGKSYDVYALETEGMDQNTVGNYVKVADITITRAANTAEVQYYSVTVTNMSNTSDIKHLEDLKTGVVTAGSAAETFSSYPTFTATTGKGATITSAANGKGVLKGSAVSVKVNALTDKTVGWEQDYKLTWRDKEGTETDFSDATPTLTQTSTTAVDTGYAYTDSLAKAVDFTGRLEQNYYTVKGDVKDIDRMAGMGSGGGAIQSATLTAGATTYAGSMDTKTPKGGHGTTVTFTVPKAAKGVYILTAEPTNGASNTPKTTMKGYAVPASTTAPPTVEASAKLDAVSADGTGKFTIFVAATELKMKVDDLDEKEGHSAEAQGTNSKTAKHAETKVYDNYSAWSTPIQVTNTGNTKLTVTLDLQKSTLKDDGTWSDYGSIYKAGDGNNKLTGDDKDTDTNGVQFVGLADSFTLDLTTDAEAGLTKTRTFTVKVPTGLENKDDVKYRFVFTTKDGRTGFETNLGPTLNFDLDLTIDPVTLGRVTAELKDGTFHVQRHWLEDDAARNGGTADEDFYKNADNSAEALHDAADKTTSMDKLVKQGDAMEDGGTAAKNDSDIFYRWYVVDPSVKPKDVTLDKTTGKLTVSGGTVKEVTDAAKENGTAYTPATDDHGKKLYLVAVGRRNATNAVRTPDEVNFNEDPVPIPYPATITLYENKVGTSGNERTKVKEDEKSSYYVWLWNTEDGAFPDDPTAEGSKAIRAAAVEGEDGTYTTDVVLDTDNTYQIWVSAYKGCDKEYMRNTGKTVTGVANSKIREVDYYLVDVADTTVNQSEYEGREGLKDDQIPDDSTIFYNSKDLETVGKAPTAKIPAKGETAATVDVKGNYVLNDTTVTFGYGARDLDYDLVWDGGMTWTADKPTVTSPSHTLTYKDAPKAAVTTQLVLNLYDVDAWVVGPGVVSRVTMTMVDGEKTYTFVTDTADYIAKPGETVLLGMENNTAVASISTGEHATFRLPTYVGTAGKAGYETVVEKDDVYKLTGYYAEHGDAGTLHDPAPSEGVYDPFYKKVEQADGYDIVLKGNSFDMRVTDNVPTNTGKNIAKDDGKFSSRKSADGLYDAEKEDGDKNKDGTADQMIILNYNYGTAQDIELTVTNETEQPESDEQIRYLYDITFVPKKNFTEKGGITVKTGVTDDFNTPVDSLGRNTDVKKRTLTIPAGLPVGRYEYQAEFTYLTEDGVAGTGAKVTYNLTVIVQPLTFTALTKPVKNGDGTLGFGADGKYTVTRAKAYEDGDDTVLTAQDKPNDTAANPDTVTALTQDADYGYQWINAPVGTTYEQVKDALSWANGTLTVANTNGVKKATGDNNDTKTYTPNDGDSGRQIFLVIYGKDDATGTRHNAKEFALSPAYTNTYKGMVALKVDNGEARGETDANSKAGVKGEGYGVTFVSKDDGTITEPATWTKVGEEWAYVADLQPNTSGYKVTISRAKDNATQVELKDAVITGDNVVTTIDPNGSNVVEAPFFTVTAKEFKAKEFKKDTGETFGEGASASTTDSGITPTILFAADSVEIDSGAPVLKDQKIAAKAPDLGGDDAGKAWTQDYTLTWQDDDAATATGTFTGAHDTATVQDAEDAVSTGYARADAVTAPTFIGGRLDQNTYKVVGTIKGATSNEKQVNNVTMKETTSNILYYSDADTETSGTRHQSATWTDSDGKHNSGDKVTFTVVAGTYTITGYEATGYTIRKVTVKGGTTGGAKRNTNVLGKVEDLTEATRVFDIYLEVAGAQLKVTDTETTAHKATSTSTDDHQFADNNDGAQYYYKQLTEDDVFTLELHNPGNVDLTLTAAPTVYKLAAGTDYSDMETVLNGKTALTDLDIKDGDRAIIKFTGLPVADADVKIGAGEEDSGVDAVEAGVITVGENVYNKDDAIYVVKYVSQYEDSSGDKHDGPTVYYVLDLKVKPLPIKAVTAEALHDDDGTLRRKDDKLDSVEVDHDLDGDTDPKGAKIAGLAEGDVSYIWYSAPVDMDADAVKAALDWNDDETAIVSKDSKVKRGTATGYDTKTYKPGAAEQGLNFYLVAYRTNADSNASEYAVSDAVYAQVKVALKAYRTGKTDGLEDVYISTGEGDNEKTSNDGTVVVTSIADGANVIPFKATMTDVTAVGDEDDPVNAKWYFVKWAVQPLTGDELDKDSADTPVATPVEGDALAMNYTATGKSTVIGYYDLLPVLQTKGGSSTGGYNTSEGEDEPNDRTLTYTPNDGSGKGKVTIIVTPADETTSFKNTTATELTLGWEALASVVGDTDNATKMDKVGTAGDYVLDAEWIKNNLNVGGLYTFTFYDTVKGSKGENGYDGYDRSVDLMISGGEVVVTAQVEDWNEADNVEGSHRDWGKVQTTSTADAPDNDGGVGRQSVAKTKGSTVTIEAFPEPGYAFDHWEVVSEDAPGVIAKDTSPKTTLTTVYEGCIVQAFFHAADFKVADGKAVIIYGDDHFTDEDNDGTPDKTDIVRSGEEDKARMTFTYAVVTDSEEDVKKVEAYYGENYANDLTAKPDWLTMDENGVFTVNDHATGNHVEVSDTTATAYSQDIRVKDEVVVYVRVTETHSGKVRYAKFVVDVEPGKLTVEHGTGLNDEVDGDGNVTTSKSVERGDAYKQANLDAGVTVDDVTTYPIPVDKDGMPMYNETVLKYLFTYTAVKDQAGSEIDTTGKAGDETNETKYDSGVYENGTWTVTPGTFQGTGAASKYNFTFTYKPTTAAEKWDYAAAKTDMTLTIAKPPVGAEFADKVKNFADVKDILLPAGDGYYSVVELPEDYDAATAKQVPEALKYRAEAYRGRVDEETNVAHGETLTYLDEEPVYTVMLKSVDAAIHGAEFTEVELTGFALVDGTSYPTFKNGLFARSDEEKTFDLKLAPVSGKVWVGTHIAKFTLTGYNSAEELAKDPERKNPTVTASYELVVEMLPKVITSLDVTTDAPKHEKAETVKGTLEGSEGLVDLTQPDDKENTPLKKIDVKPTVGPDGKVTKVDVDVEIDPNYIYTKDDPSTENVTEPEIQDETKLNGKDNNTDPNITVKRDGTDGDHIVHISQKIPYLMFHDVKNDGEGNPSGTPGAPLVNYVNSSVRQTAGANVLGTYTVNLGAYGAEVKSVTIKDITAGDDTQKLLLSGAKIYKVGGSADEPLEFPDGTVGDLTVDTLMDPAYILDLSGVDTSAAHSFTITLEAEGTSAAGEAIKATYTMHVTITNPPLPPSGPSEPPCPCKVFYHVGSFGTTTDSTIEDVSEKDRPSKVPTVTPLDGYILRGWSLTNPATLRQGEKLTLVDPKTVEAKGETMTFYAVIVERPFHEHYVIGYPNGNFGPADNINRASVATIIARAILPDFKEGANYGNPGGYGDVAGHWAESAIAYCSKFGVFKGYDDGNFYPDKAITRQEFALVIARLDGVVAAKDIPFDDIDQAGDWALDGIYTSYEKGWVNGYLDGTFKPLNNIRRDEAVKVFNAYLNRGVDADGLRKLHEYVHTGVASNVTGNGTDEYMTWPDVPRGHWAYYEIVEAANDHEYQVDFELEQGYTVPETWDKCWIDERWRYHDDLSDGGPNAALVSAGFRVWLH